MILFKRKKYVKELETALKYTLSRDGWGRGSVSVVYDAYSDSNYELIRTYNEEWESVYFEASLKSLTEKKKDKKKRTRRINKREKARLNRKIRRANYTGIIEKLENRLEEIIDLCVDHTEEIYSCETSLYLIRDIADKALRREDG